MRVIPFTRALNGSYPFLSEELLCLMAFPEDEELRETSRATLALQRMTEGVESVALVDSALVRRALQGVGYAQTVQQLSSRAMRGNIAGSIVNGALEMLAYGEKPSVGAVMRDISESMRRYQTFGGDPAAYSERSIKSAWAEFRAVAHLWAAWNLIFENAVRSSETQALGGHLAAHMLHSHTPIMLSIAMRKLERTKNVLLASGTGPVPLLDLEAVWTPPEDMPLPPLLPSRAADAKNLPR